MLCLTRKVGEVIRIGRNITVTVLQIAGCRCKLGIDAPKDVEIMRTELDERPRKITDLKVA